MKSSKLLFLIILSGVISKSNSSFAQETAPPDSAVEEVEVSEFALQPKDLEAQKNLKIDDLSPKAKETIKRFLSDPNKLVDDVAKKIQKSMSSHCKTVREDLLLYGDLLALEADGKSNNSVISSEARDAFKEKHKSITDLSNISNLKRDALGRITTQAKGFIKDMTASAPYVEAISYWAGEGEPTCKKLKKDAKGKLVADASEETPCLQAFNDKLQAWTENPKDDYGHSMELPRFCKLGLTTEGNIYPIQYIGTGVEKNGFFNMLTHQLELLTPQNSQAVGPHSDFPSMEKQIRDEFNLEGSPYFIDSKKRTTPLPRANDKSGKTAV